jgi:hypothetical protein
MRQGSNDEEDMAFADGAGFRSAACVLLQSAKLRSVRCCPHSLARLALPPVTATLWLSAAARRFLRTVARAQCHGHRKFHAELRFIAAWEQSVGGGCRLRESGWPKATTALRSSATIAAARPCLKAPSPGASRASPLSSGFFCFDSSKATKIRAVSKTTAISRLPGTTELECSQKRSRSPRYPWSSVRLRRPIICPPRLRPRSRPPPQSHKGAIRLRLD